MIFDATTMFELGAFLQAFPDSLGGLMSALLAEIEHLVSPDWWRANAVPLWNIIVIDVVLAGDNAIIVGLAASRVAPHMRAKVIFWGIAGAVILRILFAAVTTQLLQIVGLTLAGGLLLLFVCWKMYREIVGAAASEAHAAEAGIADVNPDTHKVGFWGAIVNIIIADLSMSLDNVLAVAGAAKGSTLVLAIGLFVAIVLMAVASHAIARLLHRYPWITWIGLLIILYVALDMIYMGSHEVVCRTMGVGCQETLWQIFKASVM